MEEQQQLKYYINLGCPPIRTPVEGNEPNLAPCDVGLPDIEYDVPDDRIMFALDLCEELSEKYGA